MDGKIFAIIPAAGQGSRAGFGKNKLLAETDGATVIEKTVGVFLNVREIDRIIVTASAADLDTFSRLFFSESRVFVVQGGATRTESVKNALGFLNGGIVLIHDGARPFVTEDLIRRWPP